MTPFEINWTDGTTTKMVKGKVVTVPTIKN